MEKNVHAKKRFGQNFLTDDAILEQIADAAQLTKDDVVLEIGPGTGALTVRLAARAGKVLAVEIDTSLQDALFHALSSAAGTIPALRDEPPQDAPGAGTEDILRVGNVTVLFTDILKTDLGALRREYSDGRPFKVVANLPYYISTPVIMKLLRNEAAPVSCTVMLQKEMADRMSAAPGNKDYGALTVAVQYYARPEVICEVPPEAFRPRPKVMSRVIRLKPLDAAPVTVKNEDFFFRVVEASFAHRRKTLVNSLSADPVLGLSKQRITDALRRLAQEPDACAHAVTEQVRAERLTIGQFALLSDFLYC